LNKLCGPNSRLVHLNWSQQTQTSIQVNFISISFNRTSTCKN